MVKEFIFIMMGLILKETLKKIKKFKVLLFIQILKNIMGNLRMIKNQDKVHINIVKKIFY